MRIESLCHLAASSTCSKATRDLHEDRHYLDDHPGLVPITTAQGEELRKQIGAAYYIECSSKTQ
uniref:Uncharacterized protein n=1 Tax=Nelumbo nucifera TaxID=4432 RepID=A0A822XKX3_NELNU|nr:TPA_asm: hypothetical protein HUJ06_022473 [Nelumbo nucifera]